MTKMSAKYSIGMDLGTTNSVVAYAEIATGTNQRRDEAPEIRLLPIPQVVGPGQVESRESLPSFLYLPRESEADSLRIDSPASSSPDPRVSFPEPRGGVAGVYAREQAADNPQRVVVAAKSWLCHTKIGRTDAVLPWQSAGQSGTPASDTITKVSAYDCTRRYLQHLVAAWQSAFPDAPIDQQRVVLTVPASFDPAARDLTRQAAVEAGLSERFVLLEEPQAAVYRYLASTQGSWRKSMNRGDTLLVVDVGGGTTDLTLVGVQAGEGEHEGELQLTRQAVGKHLLIGGDNMDLTLAFHAAEKFREKGHDLDPWQSTSLWHACREAKERLLQPDGPEKHSISVLGRGSSLIGGTITIEIERSTAADLIVGGFFPSTSLGDRPEANVQSGFQDIGLPYESDPAITKQVAAFLSDHLSTQENANEVTHLLLNGGVFRSDAIRQSIESTIGGWFNQPPQPLTTTTANLDTSVAIGAAFYGYTQSTGGVRIRGGTAKSFYIGIETAGMAIPGAPRPLRAVCVAPQGMEEGTQTDVPGEQVGVVVGTPARFRFFSSTTRSADAPGARLDRWTSDELQESEPIELTLEVPESGSPAGQGDRKFVPVRFESRVTELGMFELWCHGVDTDQRWKLEFNARETKR